MPSDFDLTAFVRSRPWWFAADWLARQGHTVVVHDPTAPEAYRDWRHSGILTYHTADGAFCPECGSVHVVRGKRPDVTIRIIERRTDAR